MSSQEQNVLNQHLIDSLRYLDIYVSVEDYILGQNKAAIIDLIRNEADLSQNEGVSISENFDLLSKINWDGWHSALTAESKKLKENFYENRNKANRYERYIYNSLGALLLSCMTLMVSLACPVILFPISLALVAASTLSYSCFAILKIVSLIEADISKAKQVDKNHINSAASFFLPYEQDKSNNKVQFPNLLHN